MINQTKEPMKAYIGTKIIQAQISERQGPDGMHGYDVVYADGYKSWSPSEAFEEAYRPCAAMTFGLALEALKKGSKVARSGWNGRGMFVFLVNGSVFNVSRAPLLGIFPEGTEISYRPHIDIKNVDGSISTWVPSIGDVMAEDWAIEK